MRLQTLNRSRMKKHLLIMVGSDRVRIVARFTHQSLSPLVASAITASRKVF